ncbi:MAG: AraC family transcriptional regulator [Halieaceae bacterium]|nr:AraC family transcriptional regulator [Halieaceae bacterium]
MSAPSQWPLPANGIRIVSPAFMLERLQAHSLSEDLYPTALGYYPSAKGHRMQRPIHDDYLIIYCVEGRGKLTVSKNRHEIEAGDVIVLPKGQTHSYQALTNKPWTIFWIHYLGNKAQDYTDYLLQQTDYRITRAGNHPQLRSAFQGLLDVARTGYDLSAFLTLSNRLKLLLTELGQTRYQQAAPKGLDLEATQQLMREHLNSQISLDELAQAAFLSKFHFSNRYKRLTGYSPIQHFLNMKMEYACELLDASTLSVKAIAAELGYNDPLYFSRLFKRTIGVAPLTYRKSTQG